MIFSRKAPFDDLYRQANDCVAAFANDAAWLGARFGAVSDDPLSEIAATVDGEAGELQAFVVAGQARRRPLGALVHALDQCGEAVSNALDAVRVPTRAERTIGLFSRQWMWRRRNARLRASPVIARLADLLTKTNTVAGLVSRYQATALVGRDSAEAYAVAICERRRRMLSEAEAAGEGARKAAAHALTTAGRIGLYGTPDDQRQMEADRVAFLSQAEALSETAQRLRAEAQAVNHAATLVEEVVESFNRDAGIANTLLRKLMIDAEERLLTYQAQVESDWLHPARQIDAAKLDHLEGPLALWKNGILGSPDLVRRKTLADAAFVTLFPQYAPREHQARAPLVNFAARRLPGRLKLRIRL